MLSLGATRVAGSITCLRSVSAAAAVVYVDSNSTEGSVQAARDLGADIIELDISIPFTAARARNAGFARLLTILPGLPYIQFVDGDCELTSRMAGGRRRVPRTSGGCRSRMRQASERYPDRSVYNWLCDREWDCPTGEVRSFAGNVMIRAEALKGAIGYREDVIAAEEDELRPASPGELADLAARGRDGAA